MNGLILFLCFIFLTEALYVSSPFFKSSYKTMQECPLPVSHDECKTYASLFKKVMTNVSIDSSSGCLYNGDYFWNNKKTNGNCFPYNCICKRNKATSTKRYTFGKKTPYKTLANEHVAEEIVSQETLITDFVFENNTQLYSVDFNVPASTSSDIFYKKGLKYGTDNYSFTYSRMNANGLEFRPIDNILYRNLQEAKDSCTRNAGKCRGVNEKSKNNVTFYTRHQIDGSSSVEANYYQEEMLFVRYRKLLKSTSYFLIQATDINHAKTLCDQTQTCFAYGQEYSVGDAFLESSLGFGNTVCETEAICQSHCSIDPACEGYSSYSYVDANIEWLNQARSETNAYYSGYSCDSPLDCKKKCALDSTCKGYTKFWKARAYKDYTSDLQTMNSYECNLLKTNDDLWDGGHPKESAAILTNGEDWLQKNNTQCPSWYQDQWMYMIAYPNSYYLKYTYTACKLTGQNSLNPGRVDIGMRGCRIVGQIGNRKCMPEDERNKVLWEVHYDDMSRHYIGGGYSNRGIEPLGYGQSWSCTNGDGWYNNQPFLGNPPTTDTCLCYPDTVNELPAGTSFSLNYRFEETVYKKVYYEYGVEVRTSSIPINVERVYTKTRNARQFRYGPKQNGLVLGQTMANTVRVVGDAIYDTDQILENSYSITRDSSQVFSYYVALFFKKYTVPDRFIFLGHTSDSLNQAMTDCTQSNTCEGVNVVDNKARDPTRSVSSGTLNYNLQFSSSEVFRLGTLSEYFLGLSATFSFDTTSRVQTWKMIQTDTIVSLFGQTIELTNDCTQFCSGYVFQIQVGEICFCRNTFLPNGPVLFTTDRCLSGFKKEETGECVKCFTGEYIDNNGTCSPCPDGYLGVGAPGIHSCLTCPPGRYLNATNTTHTCEACPTGTYTPNNSSTSIYDCIECEIGRYTNQIASEDCDDCALGNKYSRTECEECPIGTFNDAHDYVCDVCAFGTYNSETGQATCKDCPLGKKYSVTTCDDCPAGSFNDAHDDVCDLCDNFHYQDQVGQTSCKLCPDGKRVRINRHYYSYCGFGWGSASCCPCGTGVGTYGTHFRLVNDGVEPLWTGASHVNHCSMKPCPAGTDKVWDGHHSPYYTVFPSIHATTCPSCSQHSPPSVQSSSPTCTSCPVGQYGTDNEPHFNNESCTDCLLPLYQDETAQTSCKRCEEGFFLTVGTPNTCTQCKEGFYNDEKDQYDCKQCEGGYVDSNRSSCEACTPGRYTPVPTEQCQNCHTTLGDQKVNEVLLSKRSLSFQGSTCNNFDVCLQSCRQDVNCMGFSAWTTGVSSNIIYTYGPLTDPIVYTMVDSQSNQRSLFSSYYLPTSKLFDKVSMSFDEFFSGGVNCTNCPLYQSTRESEITIKNPEVMYGFCKSCNFTLEYYDALTELCTECVPGKVTSVHNSNVSAIGSPTPAYLQNFDAEVCLDCPLGTVGTDPLDFCFGCYGTEGKYMDEVSQTECKTCILGSILDVVAHNITAKSCSPCLRGYQDELLQDTCKLCPVGRFVTLSQGAETLEQGCTKCAVGFYNDEVDKNSCKTCPSGRYLPTEAGTNLSDCILCNAGYFNALEGQDSITACKDCEPGKYENELGSSSCNNCTIGKYSDGTVAATTETVCISCVAGMYNNLEGQVYVAACKNCLAGTYSDELASSGCKNCDIGKYSDGTDGATTETMCISCVPGFYNNLVAQVYVTSCKSCLAGTYSDELASFNCKNCLVGRSQPISNQTDCNNCSIDTYQNLEGQAQCKRCPNGRYNELTTQSACKFCEAGEHNDMSDTTVSPNLCEKCPYAKYATKSTATGVDDEGYGSAEDCTFCAFGQYGDEQGLETCKNCVAGKYGVYGFAESSTRQSDITEEECIQYASRSDTPPWDGIIGSWPHHWQKPHQFQTGCSYRTTSQGWLWDGNRIRYNRHTGWGDACSSQNYGTAICIVKAYPNTTVPQLASIACGNCSIGKYSAAGADNCISCVAGRYANAITGADECLLCPGGQFQGSEERASCENCSVGTYSEEGSTSCTSCELGKYADSEGKASCTLCPPGRYANETGMGFCYECPRGKYESSHGQSVCDELCPAGKYGKLSSTGRINEDNSCQSCLGTAISSVGSVDENDCYARLTIEDSHYYTYGDRMSVCVVPNNCHSRCYGDANCDGYSEHVWDVHECIRYCYEPQRFPFCGGSCSGETDCKNKCNAQDGCKGIIKINIRYNLFVGAPYGWEMSGTAGHAGFMPVYRYFLRWAYGKELCTTNRAEINPFDYQNNQYRHQRWEIDVMAQKMYMFGSRSSSGYVLNSKAYVRRDLVNGQVVITNA